jgi:hypothetical protein
VTIQSLDRVVEDRVVTNDGAGFETGARAPSSTTGLGGPAAQDRVDRTWMSVSPGQLPDSFNAHRPR